MEDVSPGGKHSPSVDRPALLLFALGTILASSVRVSDSDFWWHLAGGRLVIEQGIPSLNTFAHTWGDNPWQYTQWLFGVVLYFLHDIGGILAVEALQIFLVTTAFVFAVQTARLRAGSLPWIPLLPVLAMALLASRMRFVPRPHLVTFLGLSLLLWLWERKPKLMPIWFGVVGLVWGNCHAGTVFGVIVMVAVVIEAVLQRKPVQIKSACLCAGAFVFTTLANPYFFYPYLYSFGHLSVGKIVPLHEFKHASPITNPLFFLYAALVFAAVPLRVRRRDFLFPLLALPFFILALDAIRVIPKFVLVTLPGLCLSAADLRPRSGSRRRVAGFIALTTLSAFVAFLGVREWRQRSLFEPFGWGLNALFLPEGAVRFVQREELDGRLYNDFDQGGYLIWRLFPRRKVFQDGRIQAYPPSFFQERLSNHGQGAWAQFMEKYRIDYALVQRRNFGSGIDMSVLFEAMGWALVYLDGNSYIYVRPRTVNSAKTASLSIRLIRSIDSAEVLYKKAMDQPTAMASDLRWIDPKSLLSAEDFNRFGVAAFAAGEGSLAEVFFTEGLVRHPKDLTIRMNLAFLMIRQGRRSEAREEYLRVIAVGKGTTLAIEAEKYLRTIPP